VMEAGQILASLLAALASMALLSLAVLGRWPYGFYNVLRLVVCGSAIYVAQQAGVAGQTL